MSNNSNPSELPHPSRVEVKLGQKAFYVRTLTMGAMTRVAKLLKEEGSTDSRAAYGRAVLQECVSETNASGEKVALDPTALGGLEDEDLRALAQAVASINNAKSLPPEGDVYESLGVVLTDRIDETFASVATMTKKAMDQIDSSLGVTTRTLLADNFNHLSALQQGIRATDAFHEFQRQQKSVLQAAEEFQRQQDSVAAVGKEFQRQQDSVLEAVKSIERQQNPVLEAVRKINADAERFAGIALVPKLATDALLHEDSAIQIARKAIEDAERLSNLGRAPDWVPDSLFGQGDVPRAEDYLAPRVYEPDPVHRYVPPLMESTPLGRSMLASEASAATLKEVAGIAAGVADQMTSLSKTLIGDALPKWLEKVDEDKNAAQGSIRQAKQSLRWAIAAVWTSVIVTGVCTGFQMWQSHSYKLESDAGQVDSDKRVQAQLDEARRTNSLLEAQLAELNAASAAKPIAPAKTAAGSQAGVRAPHVKVPHSVHKG